jgi:hypothetical protein
MTTEVQNPIAEELIKSLNIAVTKLTPAECGGEVGKHILTLKQDYMFRIHNANNPGFEGALDEASKAYEALTDMHGYVTNLVKER